MNFTSTRKKMTAIVAGLGLAAALILSGCSSGAQVNPAQAAGQQQTLNNWAAVTKNAADQYPNLEDSIELHNLHERLLRYNTASKISYIYLFSAMGTPMAYFTIKGKVTSNASQMTPTQAVNFVCDGSSSNSNYTCDHVVTELPEDDLSYGPSEPGIFFFTTDNVMITWGNDNFLLSDTPLQLDTSKLVLNYLPGSKPSSTGGITK